MSNVNNNVEFFIDASKVSEPSESAHVSENDTSSRRKGLVSFVKTNPDSPPFKPVSIRSGTLGAAASLPDVKSCVSKTQRTTTFKFVPNVHAVALQKTLAHQTPSASPSTVSSKLDIGAVLAHSLSLQQRQTQQAASSLHFRSAAAAPGKTGNFNSHKHMSQTNIHPLPGQRLRQRKPKTSKKSSLSMSELSWIEGPSGAAGYTPITLSFLARDIDLEDGTSQSVKSNRPMLKQIDEANCGAAAVFENDNEFVDDLQDGDQWLFVQLPSIFPALNKFATTAERRQAASKTAAGQTKPVQDSANSYCACRFDGLPEGRLGTMHIHRSGRVVLHIGEHQFDVNQGSQCSFAQEVACFLPDNKELMFLGSCTKRIIITPDVQKYMDQSDSQQ